MERRQQVAVVLGQEGGKNSFIPMHKLEACGELLRLLVADRGIGWAGWMAFYRAL